MADIIPDMIMVVYLISASITDVLKKKLSRVFLLAGIIPVAVSGVVHGIYFPAGSSLSEILGLYSPYAAGLGLGALFIPVSLLTRGRIGMADAILFCISGAVSGYAPLMVIIILSFLFGSVYSIAMLAAGRFTGKSRFAFVPFILMGYLAAIIIFRV